MDSNFPLIHPVQPACALCQKILSPDSDASAEIADVFICGDCKFLSLEDLETSNQEFLQQRLRRGRRSRYGSSESIEGLFSQQFLQIMNLVRQNHSTLPNQDSQPVNIESLSSQMQHPSSHTSPSGSRRWMGILSDTESDNFEMFDSLNGESESNVSFSQYRVLHSDTDAVSFSAYGGESDASVDGQIFMDTDIHIQPDEASSIDSDTDIDPMHAGLSHWNSDGLDEDGDEDDDEWEEADAEDNAVAEARGQLQSFYISSPSESNGATDWQQRLHSPEVDGMVQWRIREPRRISNHNLLPNLDNSGLQHYIRNSGDYLDRRRFEELLEHLTETDGSRHGAPPAAVSIVNHLPRLVIKGEHNQPDGLFCAICKDVILTGTEVNQLPCFHLYHPFCIKPWLSMRNSCPLCRYELPTDDKEYEGKRNTDSRTEIHDSQPQDASYDSSSDISDGAEGDEMLLGQARSRLQDADSVRTTEQDSRARWFFFSAAPIVSLLGIVLVLCFRSPVSGGRGRAVFPQQSEHQCHLLSVSPPNQRGDRSRRWWSLF